MKISKVHISIAILVIFHLVGIAGIGFELKPSMLELSWMNLLLTGLVVYFNRTEFTAKFYGYSILVFTVGLTVEIIGVATGFPFGAYHYGDSLGWKIAEVPIVLGLNWWLLVYASIHTAAVLHTHKVVRIVLAPAIMLGLDFLIEPLCGRLNFWFWEASAVPLENYVSWYIISLILVAPYFMLEKTIKTNAVAIAAMAIQALFFISLNLLLS